MGCFSAPKVRKSHDELHPTLKSLLETKQASLPPARWIGEKNHSLLAATPSFRARAIQSASRLVRNQPRALSAPAGASSIRNACGEQHYPHERNGEHSISHSAPMSTESASESGANSLFPLPLPPEDVSSQSVSSTGSASSSSSAPFSSSAASGPSTIPHSAVCTSACRSPAALGVGNSCNGVSSTAWSNCSSQPLPLPPPPDTGAVLREFSLEELAGACQNFAPEFWIRDGAAGPVFRAIVKDASDEEKTLEVAVTRLAGSSSHSLKRWRAEVSSLARLSHPHLCKVIGFSAEDPSRADERTRARLLVYESTPNGSLESLLYGRTEKAPLDWSTRMRIAIGAAQGLAFLHDRTPKQIMYKSFKPLNIQVDKNFDAKLSDYGFARSIRELPSASPACTSTMDDPYLAPEVRALEDFSAKGNVWSFGIVLLELLTGRQNMDEMFPSEERNLLQWAKPYLIDAKRLYLIMDPELKGRYPTKSAKVVADLALQCLSEDPSRRPSMRETVGILRSIATSRVDPSPTTNGMKSRGLYLSASLGSPARLSQSDPQRARFMGMLSGEITQEAIKSPAYKDFLPHPIARACTFSGEILQTPRSSATKDYLPPPLGRSISSGATAVSG